MKNLSLLGAILLGATLMAGCATSTKLANLPAEPTKEVPSTPATDISSTDLLKAAVFATVNKKTAGDWDQKIVITKFNDTQTAAIGTWTKSDTWDWVAHQQANGQWKVLVSLDGFSCQETDDSPKALQSFFHDIFYRFGKKYCY